MKLEKYTISFEELISYYLKKWKVIVGCCVLAAILFFGSAKLIGGEIVVPPSERYTYLTGQETSMVEYIENSIIMKMDAMNIYEQTLIVDNISEKAFLKNNVLSEKIWSGFASEVSSKYLLELVQWNEEANGETVEVVIRHNEKDACVRCADYLMAEIKKLDPEANVYGGIVNAVSDQSVLISQREKYYLLDQIQGELQYTAAGFTLSVSGMVAIVFGILMGGIFAVSMLLMRFWILCVRSYDCKNV